MMHDATICKKMLHEAALAGTWCRNAMHASAMFVVLDLPPNITCRTTRHTVKKDLTFVMAVRKDSFRKLFEPYTCTLLQAQSGEPYQQYVWERIVSKCVNKRHT
jgi:hypothetical protein